MKCKGIFYASSLGECGTCKDARLTSLIRVGFILGELLLFSVEAVWCSSGHYWAAGVCIFIVCVCICMHLFARVRTHIHIYCVCVCVRECYLRVLCSRVLCNVLQAATYTLNNTHLASPLCRRPREQWSSSESHCTLFP